MEAREDQKTLCHLRELEEGDEVEETEVEKKKAKQDGYLTQTGLDVKIDRQLRELDPVGLKREIRRWARAVVRYARQLSRSLSSSSLSRGRRSSVSSFRFHDDEGFG